MKQCVKRLFLKLSFFLGNPFTQMQQALVSDQGVFKELGSDDIEYPDNPNLTYNEEEPTTHQNTNEEEGEEYDDDQHFEAPQDVDALFA